MKTILALRLFILVLLSNSFLQFLHIILRKTLFLIAVARYYFFFAITYALITSMRYFLNTAHLLRPIMFSSRFYVS